MSILRVLSDRRVVAVLGALAAAGVGLAWLAPHLVTAAIPLLIVAACPVSMVVMMRTMGGHQPNPSMGPDGSLDRMSVLQDQLAATRFEQHQLELEITRLEHADRAAAAGRLGLARVPLSRIALRPARAKAAGALYGPAPRSTDRFSASVDGEGVLTLDTGKITLGPQPVALGQPGIIPPKSPTSGT